MYLTLLKENEKKYFLGLAFHLVAADGNCSDEEKAMIDSYRTEMQCDFDKNSVQKPLDELLKNTKLECDDRAKKIFIFELIGLAMVDGKYDEYERKLIRTILEEYGIDISFAKTCEVILNEYLGIQTKLNQLVLG